MQLERVRAPICVPRAHEVLEEELENVVPRDRERGGTLESVVALRARRERDVLEEWQDLYGGDPEADQHGREREPEPQHALASPAVTRLLEREVEREQSGGDERVVRELEVTQQGEPGRRGQQRVALPAAVTQRQHQGQQD